MKPFPSKYPETLWVISIALVGLALAMFSFIGLIVVGDNFREGLQIISQKIGMINLRSNTSVSGIIGLSVLAIVLWSIFIIKARKSFFVVLVCAFAFSEVRLSSLNMIAFAVRYISIVVLISLGIVELILNFKDSLGSVQVLGLLFILWCLVNLFINGIAPASLAMLPMQFALFLGLFIGAKRIYGNARDIEWMCKALGWMGVTMTAFHICAFALPHPFLAGRFRSFFLLPTGFADAYGLLFVAMTWLGIREKRISHKTIVWIAVAFGITLLFLSGTRNAMLLLIVAALVFSFVWRAKVPLILTILAIIGLLLFVSFQDSQTIGYLGERFTKISSAERLKVWDLSWEFIKAKPIVGFGLGRGLDILSQKEVSWDILNSHNAYLGIWLQTGIIGLALIVSMYLVAFKAGAKLLFQRVPLGVKVELVALPVALLSGLFIAGFFEENLTSRGGLYQLIWGLSILMVDTIKAPKYGGTHYESEEQRLR